MKMKPSRVLAILLLLSLALLLIFTPDAHSKTYYANIQRPLVIAHQGGDGIITDRPDLMIEVLAG